MIDVDLKEFSNMLLEKLLRSNMYSKSTNVNIDLYPFLQKYNLKDSYSNYELKLMIEHLLVIYVSDYRISLKESYTESLISYLMSNDIKSERAETIGSVFSERYSSFITDIHNYVNTIGIKRDIFFNKWLSKNYQDNDFMCIILTCGTGK